MSRSLGRLVLDTLRFTPAAGMPGLAERWAEPIVAAHAETIAAWIAWENAEQWLLRRLADGGALSAAPPRLTTALQAAARRDAKAGLAVDADTADVIRTIATLGLPCVLLKGPARRASVESLKLADARLTRDVDVLVPASDAERLWRHFRSRGYTPYQYDPTSVPAGESELQGPSRYHLRTLVREGGAALELHTTTERGLSPAAAWDRLWTTARVLFWQGLEVRVPSFTELLWQALTHADVTGPEGWSLRYWLDAASVLAAQPVEWEVPTFRLQSMTRRESLLAIRWLAAACQLAGTHVPPTLTAHPPLALERMANWRLAAIGGASRWPGWREKLLDEGTRAEIGLPHAPLVSGRAWPIQLRRRSATVVARATYRGWRMLQG